jgi:hypothetical protein
MTSSNEHDDSPPQVDEFVIDEFLTMDEFVAREGIPLKDPQMLRFAADFDARMHEATVAAAVETARRPPPKELNIATLGITAGWLVEHMPPEPTWLVRHAIGEHDMVMLSGREKSGKSKLTFSGILAPLERGEATVFGHATPPASTLIYTEEPEDAIGEKCAAAGLQRSTIVYAWMLGGHTWEEKVSALVDVAVHRGHKLVFIDNFSRACGAEDENGPEMGRAAELLSERSKAAELADLLLHHHRKSPGSIWDLSRGGTALAAACDNVIALVEVGGPDDRRRKLYSRGRLMATRWTKTVELSADDVAGYVFTPGDPAAYALVGDVVDAADTAAAELMLDGIRLHELGSATAAQFAAGQPYKEKTAARRLVKLENAGRATAVLGSGTRPTVWSYLVSQPSPSVMEG